MTKKPYEFPVRLNPAHHRILLALAGIHGKSKSEIVRTALLEKYESLKGDDRVLADGLIKRYEREEEGE